MTNAVERKAQIAKYRAVVDGDPCFASKAEGFLRKRAWDGVGMVYLFEVVATCGEIDENRARHYLLAAGFVRAPDGGPAEGKERWVHQSWYLLPWPAPEATTHEVRVAVRPERATRRAAAAAVEVDS